MGFFDRFAAKKPSASSPPPTAPVPAPADLPEAAPEADASLPASSPAGAPLAVKPLLANARERLEAKDLPGALAIYEDLLRNAGDRPDVLVTLSGDLGSCGYIDQIVELIAPRYDAERHGPATGINLLQAYLATHNTDAAQHLLDILFSLNRPELEQRLYGFSNALAELIEAQRLGKAPQIASESGPNGVPLLPSNVVNLVTISKPIWAYGIENVATLLPPAKEQRTRRVAFTQLALLGLPDVQTTMKQPEDAQARFSRGVPLWLAEIFHFSPQYSAIAVLGTMNKEHYVMFGAEWSLANLRQLVETNGAGLDYVFTGALRQDAAEAELTIKVWEIKRFRERKVFTARWKPETQDAELTKLSENIRMFMEWSPYPAGATAPLEPVAAPTAWCDSLATSLSLFLTDKGVLPPAYLESTDTSLPRLAAGAARSEHASLAYLTALDRASRLGAAVSVSAELFPSPRVEEAKLLLNL